MLDGLFFGETEKGLVFYRFALRRLACPIERDQVQTLRILTFTSLAIVVFLAGASAFCAFALTLRLAFVELILTVFVIVWYDIVVGRILRLR